MNHSIVAEGYGIRLRPVRIDDAGFIVWLRNLEHAKGMVGDSAKDTASQERWLRSYYKRPGDYYFVIETACGIPVGTIGYYNVTAESAEIGRWILWPESSAAVPSVLVAIDIAIQRLCVHKINLEVVTTNERAIKLYYWIGFRKTHIQTAAQIIDGKPVDLMHMEMEESEWLIGRKRLMPVALMLEVQVRKWEQSSTPLFEQAAE